MPALRARLAWLVLAACDAPSGSDAARTADTPPADLPAIPRDPPAAPTRARPTRAPEPPRTASSVDPFVEFPYAPGPPDLGARLCAEAADPAGAPDKVFLHCALEGGSFAPPAVAPRDELVVLAWNLERGLKIDDQIAALTAGDELPAADVLLLSELDRGCSRTGGRAIAWELAAALRMNFVFGVEFVELPRQGGPGGTIVDTCEHGNAILSRYPIGAVELVRHAVHKSWYDSDEPRLGGRMFLKADLAVGTRRLGVYSLHFESGAGDGAYRAAQAIELAEHGLRQPHRVVLGGDMNAALYFLDLGASRSEETTRPLLDRGWLDAHRSLPGSQRVTHHPGLVLDLLFSSGPFTSAPGLCSLADCPDLSDHAPIWATVALE
ncbi:endonuclease/exonuclease/phosphatase family protein [Nannocystis punicea]|uniref:Endonuclease/exonuclease/phosphatase family protein n=1 Tax=Nannocystis punicea TaxID=2995304 RepID=A0ABY7HCH9_9BACT|nr:endonuclease/exonuclease/phosphatase family protein [Nannocystis poenicansa]WAS96972.1 endonuclease/exonuclease/phosphatase family protein [Nannocystis poenicansa]